MITEGVYIKRKILHSLYEFQESLSQLGSGEMWKKALAVVIGQGTACHSDDWLKHDLTQCWLAEKSGRYVTGTLLMESANVCAIVHSDDTEISDGSIFDSSNHCRQALLATA